MSRSSSRLTSGRRRTPRTTLKMAALAPMPSARVTITVIARPLTLASDRRAKRISVRKLINTPLRVRVQRNRSSRPAFTDGLCRAKRVTRRRPLPISRTRNLRIDTVPIFLWKASQTIPAAGGESSFEDAVGEEVDGNRLRGHT